MRRTLKLLGVAAGIAAVLLTTSLAVVVAQGDPTIPIVNDPTVAMLAGAAGIALVVTLVTNLLRTLVEAPVFDRFGPTIAVVVGILFAVAGLLVSTGPHDGNALLQAVLIGAFGGWQSQLVDKQATTLLGR